jgi:hypothetical protein
MRNEVTRQDLLRAPAVGGVPMAEALAQPNGRTKFKQRRASQPSMWTATVS